MRLNTVTPVLLFDYGDTLVQYYRREEFPPILREERRKRAPPIQIL